MCVCLLWPITFPQVSPAVTGADSAASAPTTSVCSHGNSGSNIGPSWRSDDESFHHGRRETPVFTSRGRRHVTSHVSGNDREAGSLSPFTGQSDRPRTESCVKRYMEILFMVPWHKAENAWLVGLTALQLEWVTEHRKHKAESLNANLVHSLGFKMTWQSWQQQNYDTTHRQ